MQNITKVLNTTGGAPKTCSVNETCLSLHTSLERELLGYHFPAPPPWSGVSCTFASPVYCRYIISNSLRVKIVGPCYPIVSIYIPLLMFIKRTLRLRGAHARWARSEKLCVGAEAADGGRGVDHWIWWATDAGSCSSKDEEQRWSHSRRETYGP